VRIGCISINGNGASSSRCSAAQPLLPFAARAQQAAVPVIGLLTARHRLSGRRFVAAVRRGLSEHGYLEGQTLAIVYQWAEGRPERLPAMAADLVRRKVAVIVASGGGAAVTRIAKEATTTIPTFSWLPEIRSDWASSRPLIGRAAM
jgi:putative tryptophan/tyrosine transport system substrate-binding protein